MMKTGIVLLFAVFSLGAAVPCYCQDDGQRQIKTLNGNISDVDWAGSKLVIKGYEPTTNAYYEVVINVPDSAIIKKGAESIGFSELEEEDAVIVRYYEDDQGNDTLISLEDASP